MALIINSSAIFSRKVWSCEQTNIPDYRPDCVLKIHHLLSSWNIYIKTVSTRHICVRLRHISGYPLKGVSSYDRRYHVQCGICTVLRGHFLHSYRTQVSLGSDLWVRFCQTNSLTKRHFLNFTDVTQAKEDTNSILATGTFWAPGAQKGLFGPNP